MPTRTEKLKQAFNEWKIPIVAFAAALILFKFVFLLVFIPTSSMYPTLPSPCYSISIRAAYLFNDPVRGDIVLFRRDNGDKTIFAKRLVGMPGDTIEIKHGITYINGEVFEEDYLKETPDDENYGPFQIPEGCYFMMGDNRNHSYDSRKWNEHFVPRKNILSKIYYSISLEEFGSDQQQE